MDTVKKKSGPKSKATKTREALDVALAKAGEVQQLAATTLPEVAQDDGPAAGEPPADSDGAAPEVPEAAAPLLTLIGDIELAPILPSSIEPATVIRIDLPEYLRDCALPLHDTLQCPADVRGRIQSELGCRFDLAAGQVRSHDGRIFDIHHDEAGHALELTSA